MKKQYIRPEQVNGSLVIEHHLMKLSKTLIQSASGNGGAGGSGGSIDLGGDGDGDDAAVRGGAWDDEEW